MNVFLDPNFQPELQAPFDAFFPDPSELTSTEIGIYAGETIIRGHGPSMEEVTFAANATEGYISGLHNRHAGMSNYRLLNELYNDFTLRHEQLLEAKAVVIRAEQRDTEAELDPDKPLFRAKADLLYEARRINADEDDLKKLQDFWPYITIFNNGAHESAQIEIVDGDEFQEVDLRELARQLPNFMRYPDMKGRTGRVINTVINHIISTVAAEAKLKNEA